MYIKIKHINIGNEGVQLVPEMNIWNTTVTLMRFVRFFT